jgi:hypothetical protein
MTIPNAGKVRPLATAGLLPETFALEKTPVLPGARYAGTTDATAEHFDLSIIIEFIL